MSLIVEVEAFDVFAKEPLPEPQWLIESVMERDSLAVLWGASGSGKSFVALDMALCIATGTRWLEKYPTTQGPVFYAAAEGGRGMRRRGRAWAKRHGFASIPDMYFYPAAPLIRDPKFLEEFLKMVKKTNPALVVIDTLARSFTGDENSAADMNEWIKAAVRIQNETGACVLIIHHTAKALKKGSKPTERGSGALRGALDTSIYVSRDEMGQVLIQNPKQKDGPEFEDITVGLEEVVLREAMDGKPKMTSLVVVPGSSPLELIHLDADDLALALLDEEGKGITKTEWLKRLNDAQAERALPATPKTTFFRWIERWVKSGHIIHDDGHYTINTLVPKE